MDGNIKKSPIIEKMRRGQEVVWINPDKRPFTESVSSRELSMKDVDEAEARLLRFAPFIMRCFPETRDKNGLIESSLSSIPRMRALMNRKYKSGVSGTVLLKQDSHLPIAGSVKARGGIYEVLKHTEDLALAHGLLSPEDDYAKLADPAGPRLFSHKTSCGGNILRMNWG